MNTTDRWMDRLSEYLDGELGSAERDALEAHLDQCTACTATLVELRRVAESARALPGEDLGPVQQSELWARIAPRLTPRRQFWGERIASILNPMGGRYTLSVPQLATAALALVVATAGIAFLSARWAARRGAPPIVAERADTTATPDGTALASFDEARYAAAVAELENTLKTHRDQLDPATVRALEDNLALIDEAVVDAKRALIADPSNPYLSGHLANQMHRKVRVLQRAAMIVAATR